MQKLDYAFHKEKTARGGLFAVEPVTMGFFGFYQYKNIL